MKVLSTEDLELISAHLDEYADYLFEKIGLTECMEVFEDLKAKKLSIAALVQKLEMEINSEETEE